MDDFDMGLLDDDTYKKSVLRQKMLGIAPVFLYKIKKPKAYGEEYSADEWNLRKPMQQCSLRIERRGDILLIVFSFQKEVDGVPKGSALFALSKIDLIGAPHLPMDHYVQNVNDSSRYFVVRVVSEQSEREALVGLGFREREEAADFVQCLTNYHNSIARERLNKGMNMISDNQ